MAFGHVQNIFLLRLNIINIKRISRIYIPWSPSLRKIYSYCQKGSIFNIYIYTLVPFFEENCQLSSKRLKFKIYIPWSPSLRKIVSYPQKAAFSKYISLVPFFEENCELLKGHRGQMPNLVSL